MGWESLADKGATAGNTLIPPGTGLEYELTGQASRRVAATGESSDLDGAIRKPVDRVSVVTRFGAASLERDPCVHRGVVTVVMEHETTLAYQPNGMAIMPFDRLE